MNIETMKQVQALEAVLRINHSKEKQESTDILKPYGRVGVSAKAVAPSKKIWTPVQRVGINSSIKGHRASQYVRQAPQQNNMGFSPIQLG